MKTISIDKIQGDSIIGRLVEDITPKGIKCNPVPVSYNINDMIDWEFISPKIEIDPLNAFIFDSVKTAKRKAGK